MKTQARTAHLGVFPLAMLMVLMVPRQARATEYHVTPSDDLPALFWSLNAGDTVWFADGVYTPAIQNAPYNHLLIDAKVGSANSWTTLKPEPGAHPRIVMYAMTGLTVKQSSFVRIEGLELQGNGQDECEGGVQVIDSHDVQVVGNWVHDFGGSGIEGFDSQLLVEGNIVWHNNWRAHYGPSGITVYGGKLLSTDNSFFGGTLGNPGNKYELIIRNNVVYDNRQQNKTSGGNYDGTTNDVTDGNGIILDRFDVEGNVLHSLVSNNVVFYNGGRCVHLYQSDHTDVVHNTCYQNLAFVVPNEAELTSFTNDNRFVDNLVYATEGQRGKNGNSSQFMRNLFFHASMVDGDNIIDQDPLFVSVPPANPMNDADDAKLDAVGYFRLQSGSPAIGAGISFAGVTTDRLGASRPNPPAIGAYEPATSGSGGSGGSGGAGVGGTGGAGSGSGAMGGMAGMGAGGESSAGSGGNSSSKDGCGCRVAGENESRGFLAMTWLVVVGSIARRRRSKQ
ncbi:MAG TPA: right-handed parallel beta-helix repeat-containing protein [Polyangium sp.]|nr:right-handed parallel beta-helix repeat-containing protein [Polyangium sp.]